MLGRFVLLASPRTGSNLVGMALGAHPAVVMRTELFHPIEADRKAWQQAGQAYPFPLDDYYRDGADPVAFLEKHVYGRPSPPEKKVAGFKLFYSHLRDASTVRFWDWLAAARDIRIIHLHRKRLLASYISYQIASATREWLVPVSAGLHAAEVAPLTVDVARFKEYADEQLRRVEEAERVFRAHPLLTIEYHDDVCAQFDATMRRVEAFLDIESISLPQRLQKQARSPLSEEVANFHELHDALEGTQYEACL